MSVSATDVKRLRDMTNAPMMECKNALTEAKGDMPKAVEILRKKLKDVLGKKAERETAEGRIGTYVDNDKNVGAIIELRCESAPVAKGSDFTKLADDLARQVALQNPANVDQLLSQPFIGDPKETVKGHIENIVGVIRE